MPYTIPSSNVATGHSGFYADQNNTADVLTGMGAGFNIRNTAFAGGAPLDGVSDATAAIQACMNAAAAAGFPVLIPGGVQFRVSQLTWNAGQVIRGVYSGTYPGNNTIPTASALSRLAGTNKDLITVPDGTNYGSISGIAIDGNKSNNSSGDGFHIADGASGQECQIVIENCFFHDNPGSGVYLGNNRRANKIVKSVLNFNGTDGVTVAQSDNMIIGNIIGSNGRAGICIGTGATQNWAATTNFPVELCFVENNDVYGNQVGCAVAQFSSLAIVTGNDFDRHTLQGVTVYDGDSSSITGNAFHSNGTSANNTYAHIDLASGVSQVAMSGNMFGAQDAGIANVASWCVNTQAGISNAVILGNIGVADAGASVNGLLSAAGANTTSSVLLSKGGAVIQSNNSTQTPLTVRGSTGSVLFTISNGGTFTLPSGQGKFLSTVFIAEQSVPSTPAGGGLLYVDLTGHLHYLGPSGTDTILANP